MKHIINILQILIIATIFIVCANAVASALPTLSVDRSDDISDAEISHRIMFIQSRFDQGKLHAQLWQYGWLGGFSAAVASRTYIVTNEDDTPERFDAAVGILTSLSGVLSLALNPLPSSSAASKLRAMPEATADQRRRKLQYGEQLLIASAHEVKRRRGWTIQGVFLLEQLIAGLAIGVIDDRPKDGLKTAVTGMLVSELLTFTLPTKSVSDLKAYANNPFGNTPTSTSSQRFFLAPHITPHARGIQMTYFF